MLLKKLLLRLSALGLQPAHGVGVAQAVAQHRAAILDFLAAGVIGGPAVVREGLLRLVELTGADELMLVCDIHDPALRLRALDIAAQALADAFPQPALAS